MNGKRFDQLDSIRGLAALIVFFNHILLILPSFAGEITSDNIFTDLLKNTPFSIVWAGEAAVLMFFVLSGFVLSLSFYSKKQPIIPYYLKRIIRLYIPYVGSIIIATVLYFMFYSGSISVASDWFNLQWGSKVNLRTFLDHIVFIGNYDTHALNPPIWSLVHEMRISLLFPLVMVLVIKFRWKSFFIACGLSIFGFLMSVLTGGGNINYFITLYYVAFFMLGSLLAMYKEYFIKWYSRVSLVVKISCGILSLLLITYPHWCLTNVKILHVQIINNWIIVCGALLVLGISLASSRVIRFLSWKPIAHLGKISFSFYLLHFLVILSVSHLILSKTNLLLVSLLSFALTYMLSTIYYKLVEVPSIRLVRKINLNVRK